MKNYRVGFKKGGNVTDVSAGPWNKKQKPKPGPKPGTGLKDLEKLKKGRDFMEDPYHRKGREGREAPKVKPDPRAPSRPKKTWPPKHKDLLQRYPKMPQPHKSPGDIPYIPMPKHDPNKPKKWKQAAEGRRTGLKKGGPKPGTYDYFLLHKREKKKEGGRTGLKKGGPKPGTYDYFLLHKREKKAFGGPSSSSSHSVRRAVKKILKKAKAKKDTESVRDVRAGGGAIRATARQIAKKIKAKKDTESVRDVRAEGGRSTKISKRGPVYNKNTGRKIIR